MAADPRRRAVETPAQYPRLPSTSLIELVDAVIGPAYDRRSAHPRRDTGRAVTPRRQPARRHDDPIAGCRTSADRRRMRSNPGIVDSAGDLAAIADGDDTVDRHQEFQRSG